MNNKLDWIEKEIQIAKENYIKSEQIEIKAKFNYYSKFFDTVSFTLNNGTLVIIPKNTIPELKDIEPNKLFELWSLKKLYLSGNGSSLHCDELDIDLNIHNLIMNSLGTKPYNKTSEYYSKIGKLGGKVKSEKKANAARENGKKGGRPKRSTELVQACLKKLN